METFPVRTAPATRLVINTHSLVPHKAMRKRGPPPTKSELLCRLAKYPIFWYHPSGVMKDREEGEEPVFDTTLDSQASARRDVYFWLRANIGEGNISTFYELRIILQRFQEDDWSNYRQHLRLCPGAARRRSLLSRFSRIDQELPNPCRVVAQDVRPRVMDARPRSL